MVDIAQKPYFQYNDAINSFLEPISQHVDIQFLGYARVFNHQKRFLICNNKEWWIDYYGNDLYQYSTYETKYNSLSSAFHMWDHLPYAPPEIYRYSRKKFNLAHGLSIIQQHGDYCDSFVFATEPGNDRINNFYLNEKNLFEAFIQKFYIKLVHELSDLSDQTFSLPDDIQIVTKSLMSLPPRQQECARLLVEGLSTKEIARILQLSPRTIDDHVDVLREKFSAKNRIQLIHFLNKLF